MTQLSGIKEKRNGIFVLSLNLAVLLAALILYCPYLEENDDAFLSMIAEGAFGKRESHLIYGNILYGKLLTSLYALAPSVRWHTMLQYLFIFLALCTLSFLLLRKRYGRWLAALAVLSSFYELYVSVQYTKTGTAVGLIGLLAVAAGLERASGRASCLAPGFLLIGYSFLLRDDAFYLAGLFAGLLILSLFIRNPSREKTMRYLAAFVPLAVLLLTGRYINEKSYEQDPSWQTFMDYNAARMALLDYRYDLLDWNAHAEELEKQEISENDTILYVTWQFSDDTVLTTEKIREILAAGGRKPLISADILKSFASHIYEDILLFHPLLFALISVFALYGTALYCTGLRTEQGLSPSPEKRRTFMRGLALPCLYLALLFFVLYYYEYSGRWCHRVVYAAFLAALICLIYALPSEQLCDCEEEEHVAPVLFLPLCLVLTGCLTVLLGNRFAYNAYKREEPAYHQFLAEIAEDKNTLYVADTFTFQRAYRYDVFRPFKEGSLSNFVTVGSWFSNSPVTDGVLNPFGYKNPFEALAAGDERVLLVDNLYSGEKLLYLQEHYGDKGHADYFPEPVTEENSYAKESGFDLYAVRRE
ncbi:MAG: hypothetical protein K6G83_10240 [Lachnospiraceae bacterium]|nr:hypothetical protein [Lachnospiraceae bacterium]